MDQPTVSDPSEQKFCPHCGVQNRAQARFCNNCGQQMDAPSQVATPPPQAAASPSRGTPTVRTALPQSPSSSASRRFKPLWLLAVIIPLCLIVSGAGAFFYWNNSNLPGVNLGFLPFSLGQQAPSDWLPAVTTDDDEFYGLYVINPLTDKKYRLAESEKNFKESAPMMSTAPTGFLWPVKIPNFLIGYYIAPDVRGIIAYPLPDNQRVVYTVQRDGMWDLMVSDMTGENSQTLVESAEVIFPVIDPADNIIAVTVEDEDRLISGYVFSLSDGSQLVTLFEEADIDSLVVPIPYNNKILYRIESGDEAATYVANSDGSDPVELEPIDDTGGDFGNLAFSPDGRSLLYSDGKGLYVQQLDTGNKRELRRGETFILDMSPDGQYVLVAQANSDRSHDLFLITVADGSVVDLTRSKEEVGGRFTSNSRHILYWMEEGPLADLSLYTLETGESQRLIREGRQSRVSEFSIQGDGRYFGYVYTDDRGEDELRVVDTESSEITDIPVDRDKDILPYDISEEYILFAGLESGTDKASLHLYNFQEEGEVILLDDQAEFYLDARLLDSDEKVIFSARFGEENSAVYTINKDGTERRLILDDGEIFSIFTSNFF